MSQRNAFDATSRGVEDDWSDNDSDTSEAVAALDDSEYESVDSANLVAKDEELDEEYVIISGDQDQAALPQKPVHVAETDSPSGSESEVSVHSETKSELPTPTAISQDAAALALSAQDAPTAAQPHEEKSSLSQNVSSPLPELDVSSPSGSPRAAEAQSTNALLTIRMQGEFKDAIEKMRANPVASHGTVVCKSLRDVVRYLSPLSKRGPEVQSVSSLDRSGESVAKVTSPSGRSM